jgi:cystathionine beta-lyase family protein involved in aluminum resistance
MMAEKGRHAINLKDEMSVLACCRPVVEAAEQLALENLERVLEAFHSVRLAAQDLHGGTGYGYGDTARDKFETAFARLMGTEAALVRPQLASGTQALASMLRALVRPGQRLTVAGPVYDTLQRLLDPRGAHPLSLAAAGAHIEIVPAGDEGPDPLAFEHALATGPDWVYVQRSRGYERRPSWSPEALKAVIGAAHRAGARVMVDNCYGEFTATSEPGHWGADVLAGSLMKNPGGGLAATGGYVAGRRHLVERVGDFLYGPGMGTDMGPSGPYLERFWQGLFYAPHAVAEALIGTAWAAALLKSKGLTVDPEPDTWPRADIVVAVDLPGADALLRAVRAVQRASPLDSFVHPEPWAMPGYPDPVVMAAGGFVPGGSLELSADAPMRPPWRLYLQGGVMRQHTLLAARRIVEALDR